MVRKYTLILKLCTITTIVIYFTASFIIFSVYFFNKPLYPSTNQDNPLYLFLSVSVILVDWGTQYIPSEEVYQSALNTSGGIHTYTVNTTFKLH